MTTYRAHIETEFGGTEHKRAKSLDEAIAKAKNYTAPKSFSGKAIKINKRWVETTDDGILWTS